MLDFGFYNMDCMDGMKEFPDGFFDLAIVDPPYGINVGSAAMGAGGGGGSPPQPKRGEFEGGGRTMTIGGAKPFGSKSGGRTDKVQSKWGGSLCVTQNLQGIRRQPHAGCRVFQRTEKSGKRHDYFRWKLFP